MAVELFSRILDQIADSVVITNRAGVIEYVNPAYEAITGFTRVQAVGSTPALVRSGVQTPRFYATLWNAIAAGRRFATTLVNRAQDGRLYRHEQTITPIVDDDGEITHYVAIGREVSERQRRASARLPHRLEHEASRMAALLNDEAGQFLALAHLALADLSRTLDAARISRVLEVRRYLDEVEKRLRDASRGLHPRVISERGLVDAIRLLAAGCERRNGIPVTVESTLDTACPASVESLMYAFVREALSNVGEHARTTRAHVVLTRSMSGRRADDSTVSCAVRDDGIGAAASAAPRGSGGLGTLTRRFAAIGGTITIAAVPAGGNEIRATVPVAL